ncbi:MAG TPA: hypothetical protein VGF02_11070, partial [Pseudolabrys sp.]
MICHRWLTGAALVAMLCGAALADEPPKATPGWGPQSACIGETDIFTNDKGPHFSITLINKCEARLTCKVWGYIVTARGPTQGATVMHLAPKSAGAAASKTYLFRVKVAGGTAEVAHRCK